MRAIRAYNLIAGVYEFGARIYSLGLIPQSKALQLPYLHSGDRVLYAGVGPGEDALAAAERGVRLTCLDRSAGMLR
ncbi:MAG: hypothetical protein KDA61_12040, partial [Planctomycetales bacterium]|nr:hypothetical protein [Planctomycetales bacterium]